MITVRLRLALLMTVGTALAEPAGQWLANAQTGLVVGQVIDATGQPVPGATVTLGTAGVAGSGSLTPIVPRVLTGPSGRFVFRNLPPGSYTLAGVKPGYLPGEFGRLQPGGPSQPITLAVGDRVGDVVIRLWRGAAITGTILDEIGQPIVGAIVRPYRRVLKSGRRQFVAAGTALTDDRGLYRLVDLIPGEYAVAMAPIPPFAATGRDALTRSGPGFPIPPPSDDGRVWAYPQTFYPAARSVAEATIVPIRSGEDRRADFLLQPVPTFRVSGVVAGPSGSASSNTIELRPAGDDDFGGPVDGPKVMSDRSGAFTFTMVPSGAYTLNVNQRAPPVFRADFWAKVPMSVDRDVDGLSVPLQQGFRISGTARFDGDRARPNPSEVRVSIEQVGQLEWQQIISRRASNDDFTIEGYAPGRYLVRGESVSGWVFQSALYNGRDISCTPLDLRSDVAGIVLTFTEAAVSISGVVRTPQGGVDGNAIVVAFPIDPEQWVNYGGNPRRLKRVPADKTGRYRILPLPAGEYYVVALSDEEAAEWPEPTLLERLAGIASRVTLGAHSAVQDLRTGSAR